MLDQKLLERSLASIQASKTTLDLLQDLHTQALTEAPYLSTDDQGVSSALKKFVALEPDKCAILYLLARSTGARNIVEAGTSFGVSTIYLALAVGQNISLESLKSSTGKVIATENEPTKDAKARKHWKAAGDGIEKWIDLREGDLRETLKTNIPDQVDLLLLDIWTPLALPALKLVQPHMRIAALVVVDNVVAAREGYEDLFAYLQDSRNGFKSTTVPYSGGLEIAIYVGKN